MPNTYNEIYINADIDKVFDDSNDIERWPQFFEEYNDAKVLERDGNKITFQLTNTEGKSWRSTRMIDKANYRCEARREEPLFPFKYMKITWTYQPVPGGTRMIWEQDFEMDPSAPMDNEKAAAYINNHSVVNMKRFKALIENGN